MISFRFQVIQLFEGQSLLNEEGKAEGREEGRSEVIRALVETCMEADFSREKTKEKMKEKLQIGEEEACRYLELYWRD